MRADQTQLEPDADLLSTPGLFFQTPVAHVDSIYAKAVAPNPAAFRRTLERVLRDHGAAKGSI